MITKIPLRGLPVAAALLLTPAVVSGQPDCQPLFDGGTLAGWTVLGEAPFFVEGGAIVGETAPGVGNSFLRTDAEYADFDLRLEVKVDEDLNSGVQFRSAVYQEPARTRYQSGRGPLLEIDWPAGTVFGYQAEIDPTDRAWSAEIHEEAGRGWLQTFSREPVRAPLEPGVWNKMRIRARGSLLQTWLNESPVAELVDDLHRSGFIALQVHSISDPEDAGKRVRWRRLSLCRIEGEEPPSQGRG